ncbi:HigA family addiction module antitoxin [Alisedimentitalea sp. MJ-SS2]|uniref:HigA family addiction module antitoxin n=1 Tax=Aliisedimentitalea sp. MJ-SS2 TaxID=3049795 RepID=UPI0029106B99|nr:HigA family addiction module antitoxin [Alisedimentitalea sp. MJ-SS2]MDU8927094.1 HigA family addiction module antitoxin [Alisedimentitalea sp. MJ-SS2]
MSTVIPASPVEISDWLEEDKIVLVDVREPSEYEVEHITGALLLPLSSFEADLFPSLPGKRLVLHCAVGKRSEAAGKMLLNEGHDDVAHMTGGMDAWKAAGLPTEVQLLPPGEEKTPEPVFLCPPPGTVLREEYLEPLNIPAGDLASAIGMLEGRLKGLIDGSEKMTVEMSMRLARYFSTAADFWIRLQVEHDMERARHAIGDDIRRSITPRTQAG